MRKFLAVFLLMMAAGVVLYYLTHQGFFPIAIVNSRLISAQTFNKEYAAAYRYYIAALDTYSADNNAVNVLEIEKEIKRAVLDKIIEDALVYDQARRLIGKDLIELVSGMLENVNEEGLKEPALTLYGLTFNDFKKLVLVPQAHREILAGRLYLEKQNLSEWLQKVRADASVIILMPELSWKEGGVVISN